MIRNLLLLLVSFLIACLVAEFMLRALGYYGQRSDPLGHMVQVDDPIVPYRGRPHSSYVDGRYGIPVERNSRGWRDYDYPLSKPEGVFRVVALGDSVLNAHGVKMEDVWAKRLESRLDGAEDQEVEVVMLALGALNTVQEAHLLTVEGVLYEPDMVIVGYILNDPDPGIRRTDFDGPSTMETVKNYLRRSSLILHSWMALKKAAWLAFDMDISTDKGSSGPREPSDYYTDSHNDPDRWRAVTGGFRTISETCEARNIPCLVVIFPIIHELEEYRWTGVHEKIATTAESEGLLVLDLLPYYQKYPERDMKLGPGDFIHPNALGHQVAADAIYEYLSEMDGKGQPVGGLSIGN